MFPSERRSLTRFLIIYIGSTLLLIAVGLAIFYQYSFHKLIDHQNENLKFKTDTLIPQLRTIHQSSDKILYYPVKNDMQSAVYDIDLNYLIGDFKPKVLKINEEFWRDKEYLYYTTNVSPHYIGAAYLISRTKLNISPVIELREKIIFFFMISALFVSLIAYWLGKLFLFPMKNALSILDNFIKDTTHELNTPVSTILANTELIKDFYPRLRESDELSRIEIASKKLSRIYDDLAFLKLNHKRHRNSKEIDFSKTVQERIDYFSIMAKVRRIELKTDIKGKIKLYMDMEDASKLIDNLISNALKYTKPNGKVWVVLTEKFFCIEDNGIGIDPKDQKTVTKRFFRANSSEGGFGLGLSIIEEIVKYYGFKLDINSCPDKGTKVTVLWEK